MADLQTSLPWWWIPRPADGVDKGHVVEWFHEPHDFQERLLKALRDAVPQVEDVDGVDRTTRYALPRELKEPHLIAAAAVLDEGILEAAVALGPNGENEDDYLSDEADLWDVLRPQVASALAEIAGDAKNPKPNSREDHARAGLHWLQQIEFWSKFHTGHAAEAEGEDWVRGILSEQTYRAFELGRRYQKVVDKPFEAPALKEIAQQKDRKRGGDMTAAEHAERRKEILAAMGVILAEQEARGEKRNVSQAAEWACKRGFGTSKDANIALWKRDRKKHGT